MTIDVKVILAATDFSRPAAVAIRRAAALAHAAGARLELMHVLPSEPMPTTWTALRAALGVDPALAKDDAIGRLRRSAARLDADFGLPVEIHLAIGRAHTEIASRAAALDADLVVVGAHGEHFVLDLFVGTTAQRVQRISPVPVLVVRQAPFYRYERVLIATDFSPAAAAAARAARRLFPDAMLHVLHVYQAPFEGRLGFAGLSEAAIDEYRGRAGEQARQELDTFVRQAGLEKHTNSVKVQHGHPPARIKERAAELDADVIVLGTQGKSWLEIGFLGSVSEHVSAESPCDVLLVRGPASGWASTSDVRRAGTSGTAPPATISP
jgi:nucleotide-binding universal stress UspA family protein